MCFPTKGTKSLSKDPLTNFHHEDHPSPIRHRSSVRLRCRLHVARVRDGGQYLSVGERDPFAVVGSGPRRGALETRAALARPRTAAALLPLVPGRGVVVGPSAFGRQLGRPALPATRSSPKVPRVDALVRVVPGHRSQRNGGHILKTKNALAFRRNFELIGRLLGLITCWRHGHHLESFHFNGLEHLWLRARDDVPNSNENRVVVLYFHGGGYALFSPRFFVDFASRLLTQVLQQLQTVWKRDKASSSLNVQILLANYRKLPEVTFPTPLNDAMAIFDYLVQHEKVSPQRIVLAGDSAGGGLVLATLLRLRQARREMPLAALCNCPYADLSADVAVSEHCFISKSMLDAIRDFCVHKTPSASWREGAMLQTDLRGLPPLFVQAAEFDILHRQSLQLFTNARSDGVSVELDVHSHMPHVFTLFPHFMMPQSSVGIERFADFITRQLTVHRRIPEQLPGAAPAF